MSKSKKSFAKSDARVYLDAVRRELLQMQSILSLPIEESTRQEMLIKMFFSLLDMEHFIAQISISFYPESFTTFDEFRKWIEEKHLETMIFNPMDYDSGRN